MRAVFPIVITRDYDTSSVKVLPKMVALSCMGQGRKGGFSTRSKRFGIKCGNHTAATAIGSWVWDQEQVQDRIG